MDALRQYHARLSPPDNTSENPAGHSEYCKIRGTSAVQTAVMLKSPDPSSGNGRNLRIPVLVMHSHFYQVEFLNSSEEVEITGRQGMDTYNNYFIGNDSSKWRSNCKIFQAVIYKNIYPNIDLRYYTENDQLKYDLVVHPGWQSGQYYSEI